MLARSMFKVYVDAPKRKEVYAEKLPGITARLKAAEIIARNIGLIRNSFFSISSGRLKNEYRRNLVVMKLISHALSRLEFDGWLKVYPDKVYFIESKGVKPTPLEEKHRLFDVIMEVVSEVAQTIDKEFNVDRAFRILEAIKLDPGHPIPKDIRPEVVSLRKLFVKVKALDETANIEKGRKRTIYERLDWSPITDGAAKDIAASGHFAKENRKVFNRDAAYFVKMSDQRERLLEANKFDDVLKAERERAEELSAGKLREEFLLSQADRSTLFPGEAGVFQNKVKRVFAPALGDTYGYYELLSQYLKKDDASLKAMKILNDVFIPIVRDRFIKAVYRAEKLGLPVDIKNEMLAGVTMGLPEILLEFVNERSSADLFERSQATDQRVIKELDRRIKASIEGIADAYFSAAIERIKNSISLLTDYDITYVISDLHLQDFPHRDTFELLRLIHMVARSGGTLVINGDLMDTWRAKSVEAIIKNNKIIFDALRKVKRLVIVKGNHDSWMEGMLGQKIFSDNVSLVDYFWDESIHIEHGHASDRFNKEDSKLGKAATKFINIFEKNEVVGPQLLSWTEYVGKRLMSDQEWIDQKTARVISGIREALRKRDPQSNKIKVYTAEKPLNVVFGHYHFPAGFKVYEKINEMIAADKELAGRVRFFQTDSWYNSEGYAGPVLVLARKKSGGTGQLLISNFLWEYIGAKEILTLYENWKF